MSPKLRFTPGQGLNYPGYTFKTLADVCEIRREIVDLSNLSDVQFVEYSMPAFDSGKKPKVIFGSEAKSGRISICGDVLLFNKLNVRKKRIWNVRNSPDNSVCSAEFMPVIATGVLQDYMYYAVSTDGFTKAVEECSSGTSNSQKRITPSIFLEQKIACPCSQEQQKIAAFFTALDEKIKLVENKLSKTRLLFETLIEKVIDKEITFNDVACTAVPWKRMALKEVCKKISYGINAPAGEYNGCWKYIRITDIDERTHKFNQHSPVSANIDHDQKLLTKYKVQTGDVLFARTGASVGKSYHYDPIDGNLVFAGFLIRCSLDLNKCNSYFVYLQTLTKRYSNWVKENSMRSGQPGLNSEQYGNFELVLPSLGEQDKIASFFKTFDKKISNLSFQLDVLKKQKQAFMREMFV